jgi:hypothetical protein
MKPNKTQLNRERLIEREELEKLNSYNPFGRSGSGAPIRDHFGNLITTRRTIAGDALNKPQDYSSGNMGYDTGNNVEKSGMQGYTKKEAPSEYNKMNTVNYNYDQYKYNLQDNNQVNNDKYSYQYGGNNLQYGNMRMVSGRSNSQNTLNYGNNARAVNTLTPMGANYKNGYQTSGANNYIATPYNTNQHAHNQHAHNQPVQGNDNGNSGGVLPRLGDVDVDQLNSRKINYKGFLLQQIDDKRYRDDTFKNRERELDKLEEEKYYQFL